MADLQEEFQDQFNDVVSRLKSQNFFQSDWDIAAFAVFFIFIGQLQSCLVTVLLQHYIYLCVYVPWQTWSAWIAAFITWKHTPHEPCECHVGVVLVCAVHAQPLKLDLSLHHHGCLACSTFLGMVLLLVLLVLIRCCCCCCGDEKVGYANAGQNKHHMEIGLCVCLKCCFDVMLSSLFQPRRRKVGIDNMALDSWAQRQLSSISFTQVANNVQGLCVRSLLSLLML